jgi:hypothetical protein
VSEAFHSSYCNVGSALKSSLGSIITSSGHDAEMSLLRPTSQEGPYVQILDELFNPKSQNCGLQIQSMSASVQAVRKLRRSICVWNICLNFVDAEKRIDATVFTRCCDSRVTGEDLAVGREHRGPQSIPRQIVMPTHCSRMRFTPVKATHRKLNAFEAP